MKNLEQDQIIWMPFGIMSVTLDLKQNNLDFWHEKVDLWQHNFNLLQDYKV